MFQLRLLPKAAGLKQVRSYTQVSEGPKSLIHYLHKIPEMRVLLDTQTLITKYFWTHVQTLRDRHLGARWEGQSPADLGDNAIHSAEESSKSLDQELIVARSSKQTYTKKYVPKCQHEFFWKGSILMFHTNSTLNISPNIFELFLL